MLAQKLSYVFAVISGHDDFQFTIILHRLHVDGEGLAAFEDAFERGVWASLGPFFALDRFHVLDSADNGLSGMSNELLGKGIQVFRLANLKFLIFSRNEF